MKHTLKLNFIIVFLLVIYGDSFAQLIFPSSEEIVKNHAYINTSLEPVWVSTLGYTRMVGKESYNIKKYIGSSLNFAPLIKFTDAWRINLIAAADWELDPNWKSAIISEIYLAHQHSRAGLMYGIGIEFRALPSYFGRKWSKGLDIGWQYTILTHIKHSTAAKETFKNRYMENENGIEGPTDGWYGSTANKFRIGYVSTRELSSKILFTIAGGILISVQNQGILMGFSHAQFPFYIQTGLIFRR